MPSNQPGNEHREGSELGDLRPVERGEGPHPGSDLKFAAEKFSAVQKSISDLLGVMSYVPGSRAQREHIPELHEALRSGPDTERALNAFKDINPSQVRDREPKYKSGQKQSDFIELGIRVYELNEWSKVCRELEGGPTGILSEKFEKLVSEHDPKGDSLLQQAEQRMLKKLKTHQARVGFEEAQQEPAAESAFSDTLFGSEDQPQQPWQDPGDSATEQNRNPDGSLKSNRWRKSRRKGRRG